MQNTSLKFRSVVSLADAQAFVEILRSTGVFNEKEIYIPERILKEVCAEPPRSAAKFLLLEIAGRVVGFTCSEALSITQGCYDILWIAIHQTERGTGLGKVLLGETEKMLKDYGGRKTYLETSSREPYAATRHFYERCGYLNEAVIHDFYAVGDHKHIFSKTL
jgi:GNAT superfamily N-acetyltransferase